MIRLQACLASLSCVSLLGCAPTFGTLRPQHPLSRGETGQGIVGSTSVWLPMLDSALPNDDEPTRQGRARLAAAAGSAIGDRPIVVGGERFRFDCSGVARGIYAKAGFRLGHVEAPGQANDSHVLFELVRRSGSLRRSNPLAGDLVFFDNTWDQNDNGLEDDAISHVGVVENVDDDGTVVFVHRVGRRIVRYRMNLTHRSERYDGQGRPVNHYLRAASGGRPARTTAELFVAFGSLPLTSPERLLAAR